MTRQGRQDAYRALHIPAERLEAGRVSRVCRDSAQMGREAATRQGQKGWNVRLTALVRGLTKIELSKTEDCQRWSCLEIWLHLPKQALQPY